MNNQTATLNSIGGWALGQPLGTAPFPVLTEQAATTAAKLQQNGGNEPYNFADLFSQVKTPDDYEHETGTLITFDNYKLYAQAEIKRLTSLGFNQVNRPDATQHIYQLFQARANANAILDKKGVKDQPTFWQWIFSPFEAGSGYAKKVANTTGMFSANYGDALGDELSTIGSGAKKVASGTVGFVEDIGDTSATIASSLAIVALVGAAIWFTK